MKVNAKTFFFLQGVLASLIILLNTLDIVSVYRTFDEKIANEILVHAIPFLIICLCVIFFSFMKWRLSLVFGFILAISNLPSMFSTYAVISNWSLWKVYELGISVILHSLSFPGEVECIVNSIFLGVVISGVLYSIRRPNHL